MICTLQKKKNKLYLYNQSIRIIFRKNSQKQFKHGNYKQNESGKWIGTLLIVNISHFLVWINIIELVKSRNSKQINISSVPPQWESDERELKIKKLIFADNLLLYFQAKNVNDANIELINTPAEHFQNWKTKMKEQKTEAIVTTGDSKTTASKQKKGIKNIQIQLNNNDMSTKQ